MKVLLLYTTHRQTWELKTSAEFLRRTKNIKNVCSVIVHCNNENIDDNSLKNLCNFHCDTKIVRGKNTGYRSGLHSAISELFDDVQEYDWVLHLHPDVFIVDDERVFALLSEHVSNESVQMIVDQSLGQDVFATDFFAFKPNKIPNFFAEFIPDSETNCPIAERFLYQKMNQNSITYLPISREGAVHRIVDSYGLLHSHDQYQAENILN